MGKRKAKKAKVGGSPSPSPSPSHAHEDKLDKNGTDSKKIKRTSTEQDDDLAEFGSYLSALPATNDDKENYLRNFMVQQQWKTSDDEDDEDDDTDDEEVVNSKAAEEYRAAQREFEMNREEEMKFNMRFEKGTKAADNNKEEKEENEVEEETRETESQQQQEEPEGEEDTPKHETKQEKRKRKKKEKSLANKITEEDIQQTIKGASKEANTGSEKKGATTTEKPKDSNKQSNNEKQKPKSKKQKKSSNDTSDLLRQIREHAPDISEEQLNAMLDNDYDSAEFDKQMEAIFNQQYYDKAETTHPFLDEDLDDEDD